MFLLCNAGKRCSMARSLTSTRLRPTRACASHGFARSSHRGASRSLMHPSRHVAGAEYARAHRSVEKMPRQMQEVCRAPCASGSLCLVHTRVAFQAQRPRYTGPSLFLSMTHHLIVIYTTHTLTGHRPAGGARHAARECAAGHMHCELLSAARCHPCP